MPDTLITNARIMALDHIRRGWLRTTGDKIAAFAEGDAPKEQLEGAEVIDADGLTLLPGFIDVHVHGGNGHEAMDATPQALHGMSRFFAAHGVTGFLPTTWTASHADIMRALHNIRDVLHAHENGTAPLPGAQILGAHVEGPYINPQRPGAQNPDLIRVAERAEALEILDTGIVKLLALAPEIPGNQWLIDECVQRGIRVAAGHTSATYDEMQAAIKRGVSQTTHTFNAMRGLHHREPGTVGAALLLDELDCELIADGIHVHPQAMRLLWQSKDLHNIILITDAVRGAGLADGASYEQDGRRVTIKDGSARLDDGTLAGSALTMDVALRNTVGQVGISLAQAWPATSYNPAACAAVAQQKGRIDVGKDADLVLLDDAFNVVRTFVMGQQVYAAASGD